MQAYKVTVKTTYLKYVKGMFVQISSANKPTTRDILTAFKNQLGIEIVTTTPPTTFQVDKM